MKINTSMFVGDDNYKDVQLPEYVFRVNLCGSRDSRSFCRNFCFIFFNLQTSSSTSMGASASAMARLTPITSADVDGELLDDQRCVVWAPSSRCSVVRQALSVKDALKV